MKELSFHYIKAASHQEIKVDGAIGGPGPTGDSIAVSVYTERSPIPRKVVHELKDLGGGRSELGGEILGKRDGREGVVRVVQATLHMSLAQAKSVHDWLGKHIASLDELTKSDTEGEN